MVQLNVERLEDRCVPAGWWDVPIFTPPPPPEFLAALNAPPALPPALSVWSPSRFEFPVAAEQPAFLPEPCMPDLLPISNAPPPQPMMGDNMDFLRSVDLYAFVQSANNSREPHWVA